MQRVAAKYLTQPNRTVGYFEPILPADGEAAPPPSLGGGATTAPVARFKPARVPPADYFKAAPTPAPQHWGRGGQPSAALQRRQAPLPTKAVLPNGLTVVVQENHANPTVSLSGALLSAGGVFDPPAKRGLAEFTASQLSRGTQTRSLLDIAAALEDVGASVDVSGGEEYATLEGRSLTKDFPLMLDVLSDELRHPSFPADELDKARAQSLAGIEEGRSETGVLAGIALDDALYPKGHPYYSPDAGRAGRVPQGPHPAGLGRLPRRPLRARTR